MVNVISRMDIVLRAVLTDTGETHVHQPVHKTVKVEVVKGPMETVTVSST